MNIKQVVLPDGTIAIELHDGSKPNGHVEEVNIKSSQSEIPQSLIDECEILSQDGMTRFIFDKSLTNGINRKLGTKEAKRQLVVDELLDDGDCDFYIADEEEFNTMPSRLSYYDTETKMMGIYQRHQYVIDFFKKLGFEAGLSNLGPEFEQSFILSIYDDETGGILYKCILRIKPNLFINLVAEYGDFIENKKTVYKGFFSKSKVIGMLNETCPDIYKSLIRNVKLEDILK